MPGRCRYALVVVVFLALGFAGVALAATSWGSLFKYFGPVSIGGQLQCAKVRPGVNNTAKHAISESSGHSGSSCASNLNRPAGYLGAEATLLKGTSGQGGTICGFSGWGYNGSLAYLTSNLAFWNGPSGSCPSGAAYYAQARARYWRTDTGSYVTSIYRNSPNLNF